MEVSLRNHKVMSEKNSVLVIAIGDDQASLEALDNDSKLIAKYSQEIISKKAECVLDLLQTIEQYKPKVLHLLTKFDSEGAIRDNSGVSLRLSHLMMRAEQMGVQLLVIAVENNFNYIKNEIITSHSLNFMVITDRNRHFPTFFQRLIEGMAKSYNFALAYVDIAPQNQMAQCGLELPGSIAVCPSKTGKGLVLWTEPQP